jgi:hypothetical protein
LTAKLAGYEAIAADHAKKKNSLTIAMIGGALPAIPNSDVARAWLASKGDGKIKKSRARLASPQPRPTSPVNGAGGITGCRDDAQAPESFQPPMIFSKYFLDTVK